MHLREILRWGAIRFFAPMLIALVTISAWTAGVAAAQESPYQLDKAFVLYWENDLFARTDRDYTNGLRLSYTQREDPAMDGHNPNLLGRMGRPLLNWFPLVSDPRAQRALSISLGQNIYTPDETERRDLIEDDRPYAGYLYLGLGMHARDGNSRYIWEIDIGVVGPASLAEEAQNTIHRWTGSDIAEGWDNQLDNEPTLQLIFEGKWRSWSHSLGSNWSMDLIPHAGARVGNVAIYANTGAELRFGWSVPDDFGTCPIRPGCDVTSALVNDILSEPTHSPWGFHFFIATEGRAVLHNIFLDGNTFQDSHSVTREPFVGELMAGFSASYRRYRLSYAYVLRTREFEEQDDPDQIFGAVSFSFLF